MAEPSKKTKATTTARDMAPWVQMIVAFVRLGISVSMFWWD